MKNYFQTFCSLLIIRLIVKSVLSLLNIVDRICSNLKYRALVKNCSDSMCHWSTEIKYPDNIIAGSKTRIGPNCTLGAKGNITFGSNVVISKQVIIETAGLNLSLGPPYNSHISKPITIEDNVWVGTHSIILGGVTIGKNSIIGAGTVIVKDVPANSIIVGSGNRYLK